MRHTRQANRHICPRTGITFLRPGTTPQGGGTVMTHSASSSPRRAARPGPPADPLSRTRPTACSPRRTTYWRHARVKATRKPSPSWCGATAVPCSPWPPTRWATFKTPRTPCRTHSSAPGGAFPNSATPRHSAPGCTASPSTAASTPCAAGGPVPLNSVAEPAAPGTRSSPARAAEQDALTEALVNALGALEPQQRVCWILRELHGLPYEQIAHVTGTTEQTVRGRLYRARRSLKEALGPWR